MRPSFGVVVLVLPVLGGCSAQLGLGTTPGQLPDTKDVPEAGKPAVLTAALQAEGGRKAGTILGVRTAAIRNQGLELRSATLAAGYQATLRPAPNVLPTLGLEGTVDLGGGSPAFRRFDGAGVYGGATVGLRMRVYGEDAVGEYHLVIPKVEAVFLSHQGVWMPPEGGATSAPDFEWTAVFALRIVLASDLLATSLPTRSTPVPAHEGGASNSPSVKP